MTIDSTADQLRQRMIEDIVARKRGLACQKSHLRAYKRFAAWLQRSPDTATADEIRLFQVHLAETGVGICTRNNAMTGLRFLFRVTLRRHDLAVEIYHLKEPQTVPMILNAEETKRLLAMAGSLRDRLMLTRSQHGRSDPLVLRRQRSDLAECTRSASQMPRKGMLAQRLSRRPSSPDACRYRVRVNVPGDREPTINACAQIKSP